MHLHMLVGTFKTAQCMIQLHQGFLELQAFHALGERVLQSQVEGSVLHLFQVLSGDVRMACHRVTQSVDQLDIPRYNKRVASMKLCT